jgi:hypothetical protein
MLDRPYKNMGSIPTNYPLLGGAMSDTLREWFFIVKYGGFWGLWVGYFLLYRGLEKGWEKRHPTWWLIFAILALFFYIAFRPYLDWNISGPNPTPCLIGIFVLGFIFGRYVFPRRD